VSIAFSPLLTCSLSIAFFSLISVELIIVLACANSPFKLEALSLLIVPLSVAPQLIKEEDNEIPDMETDTEGNKVPDMETDTDEAEAQFSEDCSPEIGLPQ